MKKCIEPLGQSRPDYEIFTELAQRLGVEQEYTEGNTALDWARKFFDISDLPKYISWEEFDRKGYYIIPLQDNYKSTPALRWYAEGRACDTPDPSNPKRQTPTRRTSSAPTAARSNSRRRASRPSTRMTRSGRQCRTTSRAGKDTARRRWRNFRCS